MAGVHKRIFSPYYDPTSDPLPCKSVEEENSEIELKCIYIYI